MATTTTDDVAQKTTKQTRQRYLYPGIPYSTTRSSPFDLWAEKWKVRSISLVILILLFAVYLILYPVLLVVGLIADAIQYKTVQGFNISRVFTFFLGYMFAEIIGISWCGITYIAQQIIRPSTQTWDRWTKHYQWWWGSIAMFGMLKTILGFRVTTKLPEGGLSLRPKIVLCRHSSFADTLIPQGTFSDRYQTRYILKKDLMWDPAFNICGSRSPQFFLFREAGDDMPTEIAGMKRLVSDLTPDQPVMVCVWPEGTRFTEKKRQQILTSLEKKDPNSQAYKKAKELKHTLLPRLGAVLALLEANPCADVVFLGNVGLEKAQTFKDLMKGDMCNVDVDILATEVPFDQIPKSKEERTKWLYEQWQFIDDWVGSRLDYFSSRNNSSKKTQ
eukprot:TRINITY_DN5361_c0_g1_i1.p1 TRINITY_DN5361_c0_g1~~TRINITY_DN5361_c0_g1_i1.p1  ORF type:complete len:388 (+),score=115.23 TRINITY_DN5361_c0_g1_i1:110-1273(+)